MDSFEEKKKSAPLKNLQNDYWILEQVLRKRFTALKESIEKEGGNSEEIPDLIIIDGGKGHLNCALRILKEFSLSIHVIAMAKGPGRKDGLETIYNHDGSVIDLDKNDPVFKALQKMRDYAHDFAISSHRRARKKEAFSSPLDRISGIGKTRKKVLVDHFGSLDNIKHASLDELSAVKGISPALGRVIYDFFHS